jgi:hypothetical protein
MDGVGSSTQITLGDVMDECWDIDVYGACSHATWVLTV